MEPLCCVPLELSTAAVHQFLLTNSGLQQILGCNRYQQQHQRYQRHILVYCKHFHYYINSKAKRLGNVIIVKWNITSIRMCNSPLFFCQFYFEHIIKNSLGQIRPCRQKLHFGNSDIGLPSPGRQKNILQIC